MAAASAAIAGAERANAASVQPDEGQVRLGGRTLRFQDLTHKLTKAFNFGQTTPPRIDFQPIDGSGKAAGMKLNRLSLVEHTGTHIYAPSHFGEGGRSLGEIPISDLVLPLVVLDFRKRREANHNAGVGPDDIDQWERRHGRLPAGCCVALWSGYEPIGPNAPLLAPGGVYRRPETPGFSSSVIEMLSHRSVKGVAVDTMNIDSGENVPSYPFHQRWLATGGWGIEGLVNLGSVPPKGAILIVGAPPIESATGMPVRAIAMF